MIKLQTLHERKYRWWESCQKQQINIWYTVVSDTKFTIFIWHDCSHYIRNNSVKGSVGTYDKVMLDGSLCTAAGNDCSLKHLTIVASSKSSIVVAGTTKISSHTVE